MKIKWDNDCVGFIIQHNSNNYKWNRWFALVKHTLWVLVTSRVWISVTLWTVACQAPLSMGFSRQEYWSGLPFPSPGVFPTQESNPGLLHCRQILYQLSYNGSLSGTWTSSKSITEEGNTVSHIPGPWIRTHCNTIPGWFVWPLKFEHTALKRYIPKRSSRLPKT